MLDEFRKFSLTEKEYNELESEVGLFNEVLQVLSLGKASGFQLYWVYASSGTEFTPTATKLDAFKIDSDLISSTLGNFGCFLVTGYYIYFPLPVYINASRNVYLWYYRHDGVFSDFIIVMSEMYKKRVPKKDLFDAMSEYFGKEVTAIQLGVEQYFTYSDILRRLLKDEYSHIVEKKSPIFALIITIYDLWDKLLTSKGVLNLEPVKKLWGMTRYKTRIETWEAIRELAYIESNIPSVLTYANLYEKGIESDFGQAILKTLENKKELESLEKTLSPMERYMNIPYEVPKIKGMSLQTAMTFITSINYSRLYQSVLRDIFKKLKVAGG